MGEQYYRQAVVAVRAMVDRDRHSDSLINLMLLAVANPPAARVDPVDVRTDIGALDGSAQLVRKYVNKYLAHID